MMKKLITLSLSVLLVFTLALAVCAVDPNWQRSGDEIAFKNHSAGQYQTDDFYSHGAEENSDFYTENQTTEAGIKYKHVVGAGFAARPQKQINLAIAIGNPEEIFVVNGMMLNEGPEFFQEFKPGTTMKAVVRSNYAITPCIRYNNYASQQDAYAPMKADGQWEEVYITMPADLTAFTVSDFCFFIFNGENKENFPEGAYADIAAVALFNSIDDAISCNIAPELIAEPVDPRLNAVAAEVAVSDVSWSVAGADIAVNGFGATEAPTADFYSHGAEENSDYHIENQTTEAGVAYKHITSAGLAARPQKQVNLVIDTGDGVELMSGVTMKAVVRTNFAVAPYFNGNNVRVDAAEPMKADGEWQEIYLTLPSGVVKANCEQFSLFIFGGVNKEDYPEGAYADIAAVGLFGTLEMAQNTNIAPELIGGGEAAPVETAAPETEAPETTAPETEAPETAAPETAAPETEAPVVEAPETVAPVVTTPVETKPAPQTFDAGIIAAVAAVVSAAGYAVSKKRR